MTKLSRTNVVLAYPKKFIEIQLRFAERASNLTSKTMAESALLYTMLYKMLTDQRFSFGIVMQNSWTKFASNANDGLDIQALTRLFYELYQEQHNHPKESTKNPFGCFKYDYTEETSVISLHFTNYRRKSRSDLAEEFMPERISELTKMFQEIMREEPEAQWVMGNSWLYNLESYCRLFPRKFTENMKPSMPVEWMLRGSAVWGQLLTSEGTVRNEMAEEIEKKIENARTFQKLLGSFTFPALNPRCEIEEFYNKYENR